CYARHERKAGPPSKHCRRRKSAALISRARRISVGLCGSILGMGEAPKFPHDLVQYSLFNLPHELIQRHLANDSRLAPFLSLGIEEQDRGWSYQLQFCPLRL